MPDPVICKKCGADLPPGAIFCPMCGRKQTRERAQKKRGNGQGTILELPNGKYKTVVTIGYYTDEDGKRHRRTRARISARKKDAVAAVPELLNAKPAEKKRITFKELYDKWLPTHRAGKSTIDCYKAAIKYFAPLWHVPVADIDLDDLQECLDECPHGKRTRQNMKAVCGLVYKYGIPRKVIPDNLNLAQFLVVEGEAAARRASFTDAEIEAIKKACGKIPHAEEVYILIYTGFRPSEYLSLTADSYNSTLQALTGGAKTDAGRDRVVTLSPKIAPLVEALAASGGPLLKDPSGKPWTLKGWTEDVFYPVLDAAGVDNPVEDRRHKYTPHSCRHTFATLMKRVEGADKDKQELIGHASAEMLRYYQDVDIADLKRITDVI